MLDAVQDVKPDIYDMTIAFPSYSGEVPTFAMGYGRNIDTEVPSMSDLLAGKGPSSVSIHSKKYSYDQASENLEAFLDARWTEKEARLNHFIQHQQFDPEEGEETQEIALSVSWTVFMSGESSGVDPFSDCAVFHLGRGSPLVYRLAVVLHAAVGHDELLPT